MDDEIHVHREEEAGTRGGAAAYAPTGAYARPAEEAALGRMGWVRWGGVWAGFLAYFALWIWFAILGAAIWLSAAASPATAFGPGYGVWVGVAGLIAIFLGGVLMSRIGGIVRTMNGALNGIVLWGLSFTLLTIMASLGIGGAVSTAVGAGAVPTGAAAQPGAVSGVQTTATTSAWLFVVFQFLALLAAIGGGAAGALESTTGEETAEQTTR